MSISSTSVQPFSRPAQYDPATGYLYVSGISWQDGTVQSTSANYVEPAGALASASFPANSESITINTNFIEGTPIDLDFAAGGEIKQGGSYVGVCKVHIGGNGTSFNSTRPLEQVICRFECQAIATDGTTATPSGEIFGAQSTIPAIYGGSNFVPIITTETLITLPDPPAGQTWSQARVAVTLVSNETNATGTAVTTVGYQDLTVSIFRVMSA